MLNFFLGDVTSLYKDFQGYDATMKKNGYYSSGEFAKMAHVTLRTIRYYDKINLLKPTYINESGARFYTDSDFVKLQQILLLKYLGFSLEDIRSLTINELDSSLLADTLHLQLSLIRDRIQQMQLVEQAILDTEDALKTDAKIDADKLLGLIHLTSMESSLLKQYQDASNISSRINLHSKYSAHSEGWFPWVLRILYENAPTNTKKLKILEVGCGDGSIWKGNIPASPSISVTLSDISEGMLRDTKRNLEETNVNIQDYVVADMAHLPFMAESYDIVIANHCLFYPEDIPAAIAEISRVLKKDGCLIAGTYGRNHMKEISKLTHDFDDRIALSKVNLYELFGKENGASILKASFSDVTWTEYEDYLEVPDAEALISYVLSCHGNQNRYILDRYSEFQAFVKKKTKRPLHITKEAGVFIAKK